MRSLVFQKDLTLKEFPFDELVKMKKEEIEILFSDDFTKKILNDLKVETIKNLYENKLLDAKHIKMLSDDKFNAVMNVK